MGSSQRGLLWTLAAVAGTLSGTPRSAFPQTIGVERSAGAVEPAVPVVSLAADDERGILKRWGIRIESVKLTAAGYMLDFRYQVIDVRKAKPLFVRKTKPVLTDEKTGMRLAVPTPPKTGALRNSYDPIAGKTYFMFFGNPGHLVAAGQTVTITIGEFSVKSVRVTS
jgi:hypothetical protein